MSTGKEHYRIYKKSAILVPVISIISGDWFVAAGIVVGYILGRFVDPDLDQVGITDCESRMMRELKILGALFVAYWLPYAYLMRFVGIGRKGHRNFFSHFPGVGTFIRIAWMSIIPIILVWHYNYTLSWDEWYVIIGLWIGMTYADTIHFLLDIRS